MQTEEALSEDGRNIGGTLKLEKDLGDPTTSN